MSKLKNFAQQTADWRGQLRRNRNRTRLVMAIYVLIYLALGLLVDCYLYSGYQGSDAYSYVSPTDAFIQIVHLQIIPYATIVIMGVALVSLFVTFTMSNQLMLLGTNSHRVRENSQDPTEQQLFNVVTEMKLAAGMSYMPKVYIIEADYMNAFASGFSEKSAMVAITRGLLNKLTRDEVQAVMAHELSHIRHGDIKLTMTASVLSNIILMCLDFLFYSIVFGNDNDGDTRLMIVIMLLRYLLPVITILLMMFLSRSREYMADAGCVELMRDNEPLARALLKIHNDHQSNRQAYAKEYGKTAHEDVRRASYLYDPVKTGVEPVKSINSMFSTHPELYDRLRAIGFKTK